MSLSYTGNNITDFNSIKCLDSIQKDTVQPVCNKTITESMELFDPDMIIKYDCGSIRFGTNGAGHVDTRSYTINFKTKFSKAPTVLLGNYYIGGTSWYGCHYLSSRIISVNNEKMVISVTYGNNYSTQGVDWIALGE